MKFHKEVKAERKKIKFLVRTNAPMWIIFTYLKLKLVHRMSSKHKSDEQRYIRRREEFREIKHSLKLDYDWFTRNIPSWLRVFDNENLRQRADLMCLEIGSWQGLSAFFTLSELPAARLTCVDTWLGADEHKQGKSGTDATLSTAEQCFDSNLSSFSDRLTKFKGSSYSYFNAEFEPDCFDLIYVDGSHHSDDVIVDSVKSFEMLKVGGIMIFDDYFWRFYPMEIDNPAGAVNAFLQMKRHQLDILHIDRQLILKKTAASVRWVDQKPRLTCSR